MFDEFQALAALKKYGTLALAGAHLRVEASTVWKRIQSLERNYGKKLLEKRGRNAFLTAHAENLLMQAEPHLNGLKEVLHGYQDNKSLLDRPLRVGLSESVAMSWGPRILKDLSDTSAYELSTHRGSLLVEKLRHGDFDFIICAGTGKDKNTLMGEKLFDEELLLYQVPEEKRIYYIEESALSFEWLNEEISSTFKNLRKKYEIAPLQSYGAIASLIASKIAGGIVPYGIALRFRLPQEFLQKFPKKVYRPIYLYSKKSFFTSNVGSQIFARSKRIAKEGNKYLTDNIKL